MKKTMICVAVGSAGLTLLAAIVQLLTGSGFWLSTAITSGTVFFHFSMRLLVGHVIGVLCRQYISAHWAWFTVSCNEHRILRKLSVHKWKRYLPTYNHEEFSIEKHSLSEIVHATCVSELVHEVIVLLSFLPLFAAIPFGAFPVFLSTSVIAAAFDGLFAILQRYNRPRLIKVLHKMNS